MRMRVSCTVIVDDKNNSMCDSSCPFLGYDCLEDPVCHFNGGVLLQTKRGIPCRNLACLVLATEQKENNNERNS